MPPRSLVTEHSLRAELANAKEQVRQLHEEVGLLRQRLAHSLGADADVARGRATGALLGDIEDRVAEIDTANVDLRRQVSELKADLLDANDSLERLGSRIEI